ncbi:MAG TPA: hypothetical protein VIV11_02635 [Kofleriaceae bacterium]
MTRNRQLELISDHMLDRIHGGASAWLAEDIIAARGECSANAAQAQAKYDAAMKHFSDGSAMSGGLSATGARDAYTALRAAQTATMSCGNAAGVKLR